MKNLSQIEQIVFDKLSDCNVQVKQNIEVIQNYCGILSYFTQAYSVSALFSAETYIWQTFWLTALA